ncbi:zinc ribbon domain-containing protein [Acidocella sp.]|uniref:zinc ribbon domain-containing protein n=1 Tax=Acidocella sp. TaxID=50710 RepID=UPI00345A4CC4
MGADARDNQGRQLVRQCHASKPCSCRSSVKSELALSQRHFKCDDCGYKAERNLDAARNLESMAASFAVSAYG